VGLLGGDDFVELDFQLRAGASEEIVVDVGENGQAKSGFELTESGDSVGPGLPGGKRIGQGTDFLHRWSEVKFIAELADYRLENFTIGAKWRLFGE
jgi:hypothetical protein